MRTLKEVWLWDETHDVNVWNCGVVPVQVIALLSTKHVGVLR
jgi:hypothetical protein